MNYQQNSTQGGANVLVVSWRTKVNTRDTFEGTLLVFKVKKGRRAGWGEVQAVDMRIKVHTSTLDGFDPDARTFPGGVVPQEGDHVIVSGIEEINLKVKGIESSSKTLCAVRWTYTPAKRE